jgi:putative flavoprotein involved in K+ transport
MEYAGDDPEGFLPRDQIVAMFERYAQRLPVTYGSRVSAVQQTDSGFRIESVTATYEAAQVVIATGTYQRPKVPLFSMALPTDVHQIHSGHYRNPTRLPTGAVLVIGSGQSGCQIAEELHQHGRKVYLSVGSTGRVPRRYRGQDAFWWLTQCGFFDQTADKLPSPKARFAGNPQLSGGKGGHSFNLHQFASDGIVLVGRVKGADRGRLLFDPNLTAMLEKGDALEANLLKLIDSYIEREGLQAPLETLPVLRDGYRVPPLTELDLEAEGIGTVIWAMGYAWDYGLVKLPVLDAEGYPLQTRGATQIPGLYFLGQHWLHTRKSALLLGVGEDAAHLSQDILGFA